MHVRTTNPLAGSAIGAHRRPVPDRLASEHIGAAGRVDIETAARLHLGFLDLSGELGRRFGSLGLAITGFPTRLSIWPGQDFTVSGPGGERARRSAVDLFRSLGLTGGVHIEMHAATPTHLGLGSGTQLCLGVGAGIDRLFGLGQPTGSIAARLGRGARSGIGVGSFDHGGFLVDGGRGRAPSAPPLIARLNFPESWRVVLIIDRRGQGLHGQSEVNAFKRLPAFPAPTAAHLCRLTLMQVMPAIVEQDFAPFAAGIAEVQREVGDHFAPAQGGRFTSPAVAAALAVAEAAGFSGIGQSSWGPTGFVLADSEDAAHDLTERLRRRLPAVPALELRTVRGWNHGSTVTSRPSDQPLRTTP